MNRDLVDKVVNAVLYEGYILYPYRASSPKNQRERFTFGRVYPVAYSKTQDDVEPSMMQAQVLATVAEGDGISLNVCVRFLQPIRREIGTLASPIDDWVEGSEPAYEV